MSFEYIERRGSSSSSHQLTPAGGAPGLITSEGPYSRKYMVQLGIACGDKGTGSVLWPVRQIPGLVAAVTCRPGVAGSVQPLSTWASELSKFYSFIVFFSGRFEPKCVLVPLRGSAHGAVARWAAAECRRNFYCLSCCRGGVHFSILREECGVCVFYLVPKCEIEREGREGSEAGR